jgi:recombination protein RecT
MAKEHTALAAIHNVLNAQECWESLARCVPDKQGEQAIDEAKQIALMAYATTVNSPALQKCTPNSFKRALADACALKMPVDKRGLAYLVPYKNKQGNMEAQFQIGYLGLIDMAYRSGKVKAIAAHCIYESERDDIKIDRTDGKFTVHHPFSFVKPSGDVIAVYATAEIKDVGPQTIVLRKDEIERLRKFSKAPNSPMWKDHYEAACKKTAIRQLAKFLPKSILPDLHKAIARDNELNYTYEQAVADAAERLAQESGARVVDTQFETDPALPPAGGQEEPDKKKPTRGRGRPPGSKNKGTDAGKQDATKDASTAQAGGTDNPGDGPKRFNCNSCDRILVEGEDFETNAGGPCCKHCLSGDFTEIPQ